MTLMTDEYMHTEWTKRIEQIEKLIIFFNEKREIFSNEEKREMVLIYEKKISKFKQQKIELQKKLELSEIKLELSEKKVNPLETIEEEKTPLFNNQEQVICLQPQTNEQVDQTCEQTKLDTNKNAFQLNLNCMKNCFFS